MDHISWSNLTKDNRIIEIYDENGLADTYITLRSLRPNKGKNMNDNEIHEELALVDAPSVAADYYIDAEGNRVEIPFDAAGNGETTSEETAFIAEDGADHPVTVH